MNRETQKAAVDVIEARFLAVCNGLSQRLIGEIEMAVDMAGLCGAIDLTEQRHFKERLNRIIENDNRQWAEQNRRLG